MNTWSHLSSCETWKRFLHQYAVLTGFMGELTVTGRCSAFGRLTVNDAHILAYAASYIPTPHSPWFISHPLINQSFEHFLSNGKQIPFIEVDIQIFCIVSNLKFLIGLRGPDKKSWHCWTHKVLGWTSGSINISELCW